MKRSILSKIALLTALLLMLAAGAAQAKVASYGEDFFYLDEANVLSEALEGEIFFSNQLLDRACGAQVVVAAIHTTGSMRIADYANELFSEWGIGDSQRDNGFLLLLAIDDENYYAVCGTALQSKFKASALTEYFDKYLESDFAAGSYDAGVKKFFEAVFARVADTYHANVTVQQGIAAYEQYVASENASSGGFGGYHPTRARREGSGISLRFILAIIVILYVWSRLRRRRGDRPASSGQGGSGLFKLYLLSRLFRGFGGGPGGGWQNVHTFRPPNQHHSSGGFGGFGNFGGFGGFGGFSGGSRRSGFGGARGGGGHTSGGGAGRGRH